MSQGTECPTQCWYVPHLIHLIVYQYFPLVNPDCLQGCCGVLTAASSVMCVIEQFILVQDSSALQRAMDLAAAEPATAEVVGVPIPDKTQTVQQWDLSNGDDKPQMMIRQRGISLAAAANPDLAPGSSRRSKSVDNPVARRTRGAPDKMVPSFTLSLGTERSSRSDNYSSSARLFELQSAGDLVFTPDDFMTGKRHAA